MQQAEGPASPELCSQIGELSRCRSRPAQPSYPLQGLPVVDAKEKPRARGPGVESRGPALQGPWRVGQEGLTG